MADIPTSHLSLYHLAISLFLPPFSPSAPLSPSYLFYSSILPLPCLSSSHLSPICLYFSFPSHRLIHLPRLVFYCFQISFFSVFSAFFSVDLHSPVSSLFPTNLWVVFSRRWWVASSLLARHSGCSVWPVQMAHFLKTNFDNRVNQGKGSDLCAALGSEVCWIHTIWCPAKAAPMLSSTVMWLRHIVPPNLTVNLIRDRIWWPCWPELWDPVFSRYLGRRDWLIILH